MVRAIDKDVLMQEISTTVVEGKDERYKFTWPDKKKSILLTNATIAKTLRPCREEALISTILKIFILRAIILKFSNSYRKPILAKSR